MFPKRSPDLRKSIHTLTREAFLNQTSDSFLSSYHLSIAPWTKPLQRPSTHCPLRASPGSAPVSLSRCFLKFAHCSQHTYQSHTFLTSQVWPPGQISFSFHNLVHLKLFTIYSLSSTFSTSDAQKFSLNYLYIVDLTSFFNHCYTSYKMWLEPL